ncbi:hypothetical protein PybrP1_003378 [[Pythium] brassicae (nom. inval.)]|nr:hypothetical protein PybrP1_003378 [[Pythium] brassicae (nom. inval.)]
MVHIINGEIVPDNDPRVLARKQPQAQASASRRPVAGINTLGGSSSFQQQQQPGNAPPPQQQQPQQQASPLQGLARALGIEGAVTIPGVLGMPPRQVEKVYLALGALAIFFFGWRALVFLAFAFFLSTQQPAAGAQ